MATDTRWTIAVAIVMPMRTGQTLNRVAKVSAMSWDLSPSSATKMTPKETTGLMRTASAARGGPFGSGRGGADTPAPAAFSLVEGPPRPAGAGPHGRTGAGLVSVSTASLGATPLRYSEPRPRARTVRAPKP